MGRLVIGKASACRGRDHRRRGNDFVPSRRPKRPAPAGVPATGAFAILCLYAPECRPRNSLRHGALGTTTAAATTATAAAFAQLLADRCGRTVVHAQHAVLLLSPIDGPVAATVGAHRNATTQSRSQQFVRLLFRAFRSNSS